MSERTESNESPSDHAGGPDDIETQVETRVEKSVETSPGSESVCSEMASVRLDCGSALRDLYGYLDGEITDERREDIRVHIEECAPCLDAFDFEVELRQLVARTCQCEAPEALRARVAQALHDCQDGPGDQDVS